MSLKKDYVQAVCGKVQEGSGGWRCPCCNPYRTTVQKMKVLARRRVRRTTKVFTSFLLKD